VLGIEINASDEIPTFTGSHEMPINESQKEFIDSFNLLLSGGVKLLFELSFDYGCVSAID
jgi:hypothetical protein